MASTEAMQKAKANEQSRTLERRAKTAEDKLKKEQVFTALITEMKAGDEAAASEIFNRLLDEYKQKKQS